MALHHYQYDSLDTSKHHIRLLTVLRAAPDDAELRLTLECIPLEDVCGSYDAISYTWGPEEPQYRTWIGDSVLEARGNIWSFLQHCRNTTCTSSKLWVDSICINQSDIEEKNYQVARMRHVYSNAKRVLVWLDSVSEQSTLGEQFIEHAGGVCSNNNEVRLLNEAFRLYHDDQRREGHSQRSALIHDLGLISSHSYWQRLWILQELLLGSAVFLVLGKRLVNMVFEDRKGGHCSRDNSFWTWLPEPADNLVRERRGKATHSLWTLIDKWGGQRCQNPLDKIYGLLGLTRLADAFSINYDYQPEQLLLYTLNALAEREVTLNPPATELYPGLRSLSQLPALGLDTALKVMTILGVTYPSIQEYISRGDPMSDESQHLNCYIGCHKAMLFAPCRNEHRDAVPCDLHCVRATEATFTFPGHAFSREDPLFSRSMATLNWGDPEAFIGCKPGGTMDQIPRARMLIFGRDKEKEFKALAEGRVKYVERMPTWEFNRMPDGLRDAFMLMNRSTVVRWGCSIAEPELEGYIKCSMLGLLYLATR